MARYSCRKCGSGALGVRRNVKNPNAYDLFCLSCGNWVKFANSDDRRLYGGNQQELTMEDMKIIMDALDKVRAGDYNPLFLREVVRVMEKVEHLLTYYSEWRPF